MTGYARAAGAHGEARWVWEIKSVNARGLELRFRLPTGRDGLEPTLRKRAGARLSRGAVSAALTLDLPTADGAFVVNEANLAAALNAMRRVAAEVDCEKPRPEGVLALRGVIETAPPRLDRAEGDALDAAIVDGFERALDDLAAARVEEGARLAKVVDATFDELARLADAARADAAAAPEAILDRLRGQLTALLAGEAKVDDDRLEQEAAAIAVKADVREELDRLDAHLAAGRELLAAGGAVGRRLDFLTQELNREANTLCAKAANLTLKRVGLDLKTAVDRVREQAQNIE